MIKEVELEKIATEYADRVCSGDFPIEYTRQQVVQHTKNDFIQGVKAVNMNYNTITKQLQMLHALLEGYYDGIEEDHTCDVIEKSFVLSVLEEIRNQVIKIRNTENWTKCLLLFIFPLTLFSQPDTLHLSGSLGGTYTAKEAILIDSANSYNLFGQPVILQIGACDTLDGLIPAVAVLGDSCIRDAEWNGITGYSDVLVDSASFFTPQAMELFKWVGCMAYDDCGIDSFYVKSLEIVPPGGVDRPGMTTREFRVTFRAVDWVGYSKEALMTWIRVPDSQGCY